MNIYLIQLISKWINVLFISMLSFFNVSNIKNYINYNSSLPLGEKKIVKEGKKGITYKSNENNNIIIKKPESEIIEQGTKEEKSVNQNTNNTSISSIESYNGKLTSYSAGCKGCSLTGTVACKTNDNKSWSLINDGVYYNDSKYGSVRILSAATSKFSCGSIIEINKD